MRIIFSLGHVSRALRLAHVSLALIGLMWVLPFVYKHHAPPLITFYQEWGAAALGLCAMLLLVMKRFWQQPEIPRIALLPLGLMFLVWVQFALGKIDYFDQALRFTLIMLWATLLIMLGQRLREELGLPVLATVLAAFLLLGAALNTLVGVVQQFGWAPAFVGDYLITFVGLKVNPGVTGNLGQPNHFANYITLGLISLGLLYSTCQMRVWQVALLAAPLLFVLTLSGSRSPSVYLLCMVCMAFLWQRRDKSNLPLLHYSLLLILGFALMHGVVQIPLLAGSSATVTSGGNLFSKAAGDSFRLAIWRDAWLIFTRFPWLGAGFEQFSWQQLQLVSHGNTIGWAENAHNIVMQIASEMGMAGLFILMGTLALWFRQAHSAKRSIYHWWGYCLLGVLAIHSLLEYPLWYIYFLGVAAFTLGMLDATSYSLRLRGLAGRLSVATMLLLGLMSLSQMLYLYKFHNLEYIASSMEAAGKAENDSYAMRVRIQLIHDHLMEVHKHALLLRPYAERLLAEAGWDHDADKGALNRRVMHFSPNATVVYREAWVLAQAGQQAEARMQLERAIWAYPNAFSAAIEDLRDLALEDPGHFADLLNFTQEKYMEHQPATHANTSHTP